MNNNFQNNRLAAKVASANKANKVANELYDNLLPVLKEWLGKKVVNADGILTKVFAGKLLDIVSKFEDKGLRILFYARGSYSLRVNIISDVYYSYESQGEKRDSYERHERIVYLFELSGHQFAEKLYPKNKDYRTNWTPEEVKEKTTKMEVAREVARSFESELELMT